MEALSKRYTCVNNGYDNGYDDCYSAWDEWARWVVLAIIIIGAILIFFLFSCISARRRRRMGYAPYRGTGWATGGGGAPPPPPEQFNQTPYYASNYQPPPPTYQGYYGRDDVEMQPQANPYTNVYAPPTGPPPRKA